MLRKLIFLMSALILTMSITFLIQSNNERTKIDKVLSEKTYFFPLNNTDYSQEEQHKLFDYYVTNDKKKLVNLYVYYYNTNNTRQVFLDINSNKTKVFDVLNIDSQLNKQKEFFDSNNRLDIYDLNDYLNKVKDLPSGIYIQGTDKNIDNYLSEIKKTFPDVGPDRLEEVILQPPILTNQLLYTLLCLLLVPFVMSLIINFFNQYNKVMIYMVNGLSKNQVIMKLTKNDYKFFLLSIPIILILITLFSPVKYQRWLILSLVIYSFIFFLSGIISILFISQFKVNYQYLYNKKPLKKLNKINMSIQIISLLFLTFFIQTISPDIQGIIIQKYQQSTTEVQLKEYTSSRRLTAGVDDEKDDLVYESFFKSNQLFDEWLDRGLIVFYPSGDTINRLVGIEYEPGFESNEVLITPEYLKKNPLVDEDNQKITIENEEQALIQLVPISLKSKEKELKKYLEEDHSFVNREVGSEFGERAGRKVEKLNHSKIKIVYIKNYQTFHTYQSQYRSLQNPMFRVITKNNRSAISVYADNIMGGNQSFFVKKNEKYKIGDTYDIDPNQHLNEFSMGLSASTVLINENNENLRSMYPILGVILLLLLIFINSLIIHISSYYEIHSERIMVLKKLGFDPIWEVAKSIYLIMIYFVCLILVNTLTGKMVISIYYTIFGVISVVIFLISYQKIKGR